MYLFRCGVGGRGCVGYIDGVTEKATPTKDPLRTGIHVAVYVALYFATAFVFSGLLLSLGGYLTGVTGTGLLSAIFANWLALKIYEDRHLIDIGLWLNRASAENLMVGLAGGAGAAVLVLAPALAVGAAHLVNTPDDHPTAGSIIFVSILLAAGSVGEELFFRGYGFQQLLVACGPWATVIPVGVVFGLLHGGNPSASWFSAVNTAGFGILFGYGYLRSRDLWLPIGLHFGWNFTLPLFGVNVSGLRMKVTGYEMAWSAGNLWSGGEYGPEASVLTSAVLVALAVYVWKAPVRRQFSPLTDPPAESAVCEGTPSLPS
ncbi:MAG: Abortive infection protein [Candidatus Solibacter sp.]|nr:Abortive infection protein [Candidatus Solibacter sp.]